MDKGGRDMDFGKGTEKETEKETGKEIGKEIREEIGKGIEDEFEMKDRRYRSSTLTNGLGRSGQRALLYATGMDEEDMKKPFVAVIGSFSEMVPGHVHLRELADYVKQGIIEAGGVDRKSVV